MANSPARAVVDVGSVIADTYKIEALLGRGGMGAVFLASHLRLAGKQVAIKILHTELEDTDIVARFRREAEIAAKLNHPNIVGVIDYNVTPEGMPYLVLDYLEGETLAQRIARGPMALEQVVSIVRQVGSALAAAHRGGIVHRDLKPQNIFLVPTEVDGRFVEIAKVLDFGISKIRGSQTVKTQDSALLGTPQYMAPEQAMGQHANVDERTDVFAFGAIVYEMLSGQAAFAGASIPEVVFKVVYEQPAPLSQQVPSLPPGVAVAVAQAMAKPSDERFPTIAGFVEAMTGQPLTLTRGQPPAPVAGADSPSARRVATGEAFARTMGSGNHGDSPVNPMLATAPGPGTSTSPPPTASRAAPTIDMGTGPGAAPARRRPIGAIAAIVVAGAAVAGVAVYVATRPSDPTRDDRPSRRVAAATEPVPPPTAAAAATSGAGPGNGKAETVAAAAPPAAPTAPAAPAQPAAVAAAEIPHPTADTAVGGGKGSSKPARPDPKPHRTEPKPTEVKPPEVKPPGPPHDDDNGPEEDDEVRQKLKQANIALEHRNYDVAERLATAIINSPAGPRQRATARLIHGTVQCVARNDQEAAGIDLRGLEGFRVLRQKLLAVCKSHGVLTGP